MVKINYLPQEFRRKTVKEKLERVCEENDIVFLALFGSFAVGKPNKKSDVDILVKFDEAKRKTLLDLIHTENEMKKLFKRDVDLLTEGSLGPYLKNNILKSMRVVYER